MYDLAQLRSLLQLVAEYDLHELELAEKGCRVRIVRRRVRQPQSAAPQRRQWVGAAYEESLRLAEMYEDGVLHFIKAPFVGTYLLHDDSGTPQVTVGEEVAANSPIGMIVALGIRIPVVASVTGTVVAIYASEAQSVEYGQLLVALLIGGKEA